MHSRMLRGGAMLIVPLALGLAAMPVAGAQPDPTDESVAVDAMLVADDLSWAADATGVTVTTDESVIDLPGYVEQGGVRQVSQNWISSNPPRIVFDFRFQFPDASSAEAFLDASEAVLGEVHSGGQPQVPPVSPVADTRYYRQGLIGHNFLMRHESLVAKVYVSAIDGPDSVASKVAEAAATRMVAALGGPAPSAPPSPSADSAVALEELLSHIPGSIRESCALRPLDADDIQADGELVAVSCPQSDEMNVLYSLYEDVESLDAEYDVLHEVAEIIGADMSADDCAAGSFDGVWRFGNGEEAGRMICFVAFGTSSIDWSHPATRILSMITHAGGGKAAAYDLWIAAGPE